MMSPKGNDSNNKNKGNQRKCNICGSTEHLQYDCPKKNKNNLDKSKNKSDTPWYLVPPKPGKTHMKHRNQ